MRAAGPGLDLQAKARVTCTLPGRPLPHAWVEGEDGRRRSTLDLVRPGRFLLITGEEGTSWVDAGRIVADELGVPLDVVAIGHTKGDFLDPRSSWVKQREISPDGAVLVRPDRFVAWRSPGGSDHPQDELHRALKLILRRDAEGDAR